MAETARGKSQACWWPDGKAELLTLDGYKELRALVARGSAIPGSWNKGASSGAVAWHLREGKLLAVNLHDKKFERTWAECAEHGLVLGVGMQKGKLGARASDSGLVWREDGSRHEIAAGGDVCLKGTDGVRMVGSVTGRAALWPDAQSTHVDLNPAGYMTSEAHALDGESQAGIVFKGFKARAALWRGSAASFVDLTPDGYEVSRAFHAAAGLQVGLVRRTDTTANGSSSLADEAALWQGANDKWMDLNSLLPPTSGLNASAAWSIASRSDRLQVCGEANRYEASDPGTDRESHFVPDGQAVVWTARRR